ncbi:MAG: NADPH-dependent FMN reductase [Gemmataceae bacterium]
MPTPKILAFAGATRSESFNKKLIRVMAALARDAGAEVTLIDLRDFPMPLYDGDLEQEKGLPENALRLKEMFKAHHGFLISAPEYNSSITAVLKNTIDWVSRPIPGEKRLEAYVGKTALLVAASPGALGGLRGLYALRWILANIFVTVLPEQRAVHADQNTFAADGSLSELKLRDELAGMAKRLVEVTGKVVG